MFLLQTFLINRFPSRILNNKTPNEVLFGTPPIYSNLKTFGCLCFVLTMEKHRDKFLPRATTGVFIDYHFGKKGYKVLILDSLQIVVSRNAIFHENIFIFHKSSLDISSSLDHILEIVSENSSTIFENISLTQPQIYQTFLLKCHSL